ncbi:MAG: hypothetical protein WEA61_03915 [Anaerolineales bacterium]
MTKKSAKLLNSIFKSHRYLLDDAAKATAVVDIRIPTDGIYTTSVFFNTDGEHLLFNDTDLSSVFANLKLNAQVRFTISNPKDVDDYIQFHGRVKITHEKAAEHAEALLGKYGPQIWFHSGNRVMFVLTPDRVALWPPQR